MVETASTQLIEHRVTELERIAADQERVIGDLSGQIAAQWAVIERLRKRMDALVNRLGELEDLSSPDVPITKPPHW